MAYSLRELRRDVTHHNTPVQRRIAGWLWQMRNARARRSARPDPAALRVVFAIPLIGRHRAENWEVVQQNLSATLTSLRRQRDPRWTAVICGQDAPECVAWDDQVRFVRFADTPPSFDRTQKVVHLRDHVERALGGAGYFFPLDADDLIHPNVVAHILNDDNRAGYLIEKGYMLDHAALDLAALQPPDEDFPKATHFHRNCGSSSAIYFDFDSGADYRTALWARGNHRKVMRNMAYLGIRIAHVPFHAAIYVMNHGDNLRQKRGKMSGKMQHFDLSPIRDPNQRHDIGVAFGLAEIFGARWIAHTDAGCGAVPPVRNSVSPPAPENAPRPR
ncbi:MAG: glycosyltransferase family 2 protein [Pseudomonadota bacterium]